MGTTLLPRHSDARRALRRALSFPVLIFAVSVAAACSAGNGLTSPATADNAVLTYSVYALSGTPNTLPAAYQYTTETLVRPYVSISGAINFELAFDLTADGKVLLLPAKAVVPLPPAGSPSVGLQKMTANFDALTRAPLTGYTLDTAQTVTVGQTYALQLHNSGCVYGDFFYVKLVVDSIIVPERRMVIRSLVNRNCGYRSLLEGLPKD
jgi:hypothetical protein